MTDGEGAVMKVPLITLFSSIVLALVLFTGQVKADWEQVANNIEVITALEYRISEISMLVGMMGGFIEQEELDELKVHSDIYFVYYFAAQVALANEEMEDFKEYIEEADNSLDRMMEIIETPPPQQQPESPSTAPPFDIPSDMQDL